MPDIILARSRFSAVFQARHMLLTKISVFGTILSARCCRRAIILRVVVYESSPVTDLIVGLYRPTSSVLPCDFTVKIN